MKTSELETIVLGIIEAIEKDINDWKESESIKITELEQQFSDLLKQLENLDDLQTRLRRLLNELENTSNRLSKL